MIPTAIGIRRRDGGRDIPALMQTWLQSNGLGVYTPQVWTYGESDNLSAEWNADTGGLNWKPATVGHLAKLTVDQGWVHVMQYNGYFYGAKDADSYRTVAWPDPRTGLRVDQDLLGQDLLALYLRRSRQWMLDRRINPYMVIDEPPHREQEGLTTKVKARVIGFGAALNAAEFPYAVCVANWQGLHYWTNLGLRPDWWLLNEKHDYAIYAPYLPVGARVGVYNVRSTKGLAKRLAEYGPRGAEMLLQWHATPWTQDNDLPQLFDVIEQPASVIATAAAIELAKELRAYMPYDDTPETPSLAEQVTVLQGEVAELRRRVQTLEGARPPAPATKAQPVDLALFYASDAPGWQRELGRLAKYPQAVIQADLSAVTADSSGKPYANGQTPLRYLEDRGVQTWLYVSPWWLWTASGFGKGEWFRKAQVALADNAKAWLRDRQGISVPVFGGKMRVADPRATAYVDALAEAMLALPHYRFFLDNTFYHQGAYHRWLVPDDVWHEAACRLYDRLRSAGKQVILNSGWEMADPTANVWQWPLREHCDGVAVEIPAMFTGPAGQWTLFDYAPMDTAALEHVALDWQLAGKVVFVIARHKRSEPVQTDDSPFPDLARHRTWWRSLAKAKSFSVSAQTSYNAIPEREDD